MAFLNIDSNNLGSLLQIFFTDGVRNQISQDIRDFEAVRRLQVKSSLAREIRFQLLTGYGPASVQYRNPGQSGRTFPRAFQSKIGEKTAKLKELNTSIELEYSVWYRASQSKGNIYSEPLALEMDSKLLASKRQLGKDMYLDGTGVIGQLPAAAATVNGAGQLVFQLDTASTARGHIGSFEFDDIYILRTQAGAATALDTNLATEPAYLQVVDINRELDQVTMQGLDVNFAVLTIASITTQAQAASVFYRFDQPTIPDLTAPIADYGTVTEVMPGLASLTATDGRVIHGITMSGATSGSEIDGNNNPLDVTFIQKALDKAKNRVGQGKYSWKMMNMAHEAHASLIESRETDRRFQSIEDNKRGVRVFAYVHGTDVVECNSSEFVPKKRIYILPEQKSGDKVLEYHGSDFSTVKAPGGSDWHLKPGATGGHVNQMVSYMLNVGTLICKHPASIAVVKNFTV